MITIVSNFFSAGLDFDNKQLCIPASLKQTLTVLLSADFVD